jgi:hypothetical protein
MVGSCPAIANYVRLLPLCDVHPRLIFPELAPQVDALKLDPSPVICLPLKFGCLYAGVILGVVIVHGVMGSTLTLTWIGVLPYFPSLRLPIFIS